MKRTLAALRLDVLFQFRHGFYYAYLFVALLYGSVLLAVPEAWRISLATMVLFSDPAIFGYFFVGGLFLLERSENTTESLFVTPLRISEYIFGKMISLTIIALVTGLLIALLVFGLEFNVIPLSLGVGLSSLFFVVFGLGVAARYSTMSDLLVRAPLYMVLFFLPLIEFLGFRLPEALRLAVRLLPSYGGVYLINRAFVDDSTSLGVLGATAILAIWIGIAYKWGKHAFHRFVILGEGGSSR